MLFKESKHDFSISTTIKKCNSTFWIIVFTQHLQHHMTGAHQYKATVRLSYPLESQKSSESHLWHSQTWSLTTGLVTQTGNDR